MGIKIDELDLSLAPSAAHELPAMKDGVTEKLTVEQILELARALIMGQILDGAPGALDTLNELAAALGDDANFAATVTNALALKAPLASPALTGNPTAPTQTPGNNSTRLATTAFVAALAATLQPLDAMLTAMAAMTSSSGQYMGFAGADSPALRDILGTVTITAGKPTGALFQEGNNANGFFIKFANKTQIAWHQLTIPATGLTPYGNIWLGGEVDWTFPVAFTAVPRIFAFGFPTGSRATPVSGSAVQTTTGARFQNMQMIGSGEVALGISALAIGYGA